MSIIDLLLRKKEILSTFDLMQFAKPKHFLVKIGLLSN